MKKIYVDFCATGTTSTLIYMWGQKADLLKFWGEDILFYIYTTLGPETQLRQQNK